MKSKKLTTYILIVILLLIAAYWAYRFSAREPEPVGVTVTGAGALAGGSTLSGSQIDSALQFIKVLESVSQITLAERSLLANRIFQTKLQDFGRPLAERPWGRNNPFAAPGVGGGPVQVTATTTAATDSDLTGLVPDNLLSPTSVEGE